MKTGKAEGEIFVKMINIYKNNFVQEDNNA